VLEPLAYLDGAYVPASQARLPVYDYGLVQGAAVVEQTRTFGGRPFRLDDHLDRFASSLALARIELAPSRGELIEIGERLLAHNFPLLAPVSETGAPVGELGLIHIATPGAYAPYGAMTGAPAAPGPTLCVHTYPLPLAAWREKYQTGVRLVTPSIRQVPLQCWPPQLKARSRLHYYLAERETQDIDPQAWPLLLDLEGRLTETSAANVLLVAGRELLTPRFDRTLAGISRRTLLELAAGLSLPTREEDLTVDDALAADELLLTSTGFCLLACTSLNGRAIGAGRPGPVFARLLAAYEALAGVRFAAPCRELE
jgi:branched-subunit amino acid aminotransferase/4-amino-4-deoxychorismate lyase